MKKTILSAALLLIAVTGVWAQKNVMRISHGSYNDYALLSDIDSLYLNADGSMLMLQPANGSEAVGIERSQISQICYLSEEEAPSKLKIAFSGTSASIENPYLLHGVKVSLDGAYVTVDNNNEAEEIETELSGTTTNGSYTYNGTYKTTLVLNGVNITSQKGAAIEIQCGKRVDLELKKETVSTLVDAAGGTQKAALHCKGHLEIDKAGTLNVTGKTGHAISAGEYIKLKKSSGVINILGAAKDGIHCKQYFLGNGFTVNISGTGDDGILCDLDDDNNATASTTFDDYTNGTLIVNDGSYNITLTGTAANAPTWGPGGGGGGGGGGGWPGGDDTTEKHKGMKGMGPVMINGGNLLIQTTVSGAEGLESKTSIKISGGNHYFKCYDDCINSSGIVEFAGGNTVCYGYGNDAVDSNYGRLGAITISGGSVFAYTTKGSPEEGLDCDNNSYIKVTGGIAVSAGGSQGGGGGWGGSSSSSSIGSSTQGYYLGSSPSSYQSSYYYTLCNTSGEAICTYKFEANVSNSLSLLTAPNLGKGSVTVKRGTAAPTASETQVCNASGTPVFFVSPTVTTTGTAATVTAK